MTLTEVMEETLGTVKTKNKLLRIEVKCSGNKIQKCHTLLPSLTVKHFIDKKNNMTSESNINLYNSW